MFTQSILGTPARFCITGDIWLPNVALITNITNNPWNDFLSRNSLYNNDKYRYANIKYQINLCLLLSSPPHLLLSSTLFFFVVFLQVLLLTTSFSSPPLLLPSFSSSSYFFFFLQLLIFLLLFVFSLFLLSLFFFVLLDGTPGFTEKNDCRIRKSKMV